MEDAQHTWSEQLLPYLPLERLAEGPQFAAKKRSAILQIADSISFVFNRHFTRGEESDIGHCYESFADYIYWDAYITA